MMNVNIIDITIILFICYFAYSGFKNGFIRELGNIIAYISAFLLSKTTFEIISNHFYLDIFIKYEALRDKIAYLLSFILIVYIFRLISNMVEKFINMKWQNKLLGFKLGIVTGILIFALIISIFKELPSTINIHEEWNEQSYLYQLINTLQQDYLVQYIKKIN